MAEIGSGSGSGFPSALDTNSTLEYDKESTEKTLVRADVVNDIGAGLVAIETELGTDPAGSKTDVKTRLAIHMNNDGTLKDEIRIYNTNGLTTLQLTINDLPT